MNIGEATSYVCHTVEHIYLPETLSSFAFITPFYPDHSPDSSLSTHLWVTLKTLHFTYFLFLTELLDVDMLLIMSLILPFPSLLFSLYNSFKHQLDRLISPKFISLSLIFRFIISNCLISVCMAHRHLKLSMI